MGQIIYQYLPLQTFHTAITNKTIRLSDISKSNDYQEKVWFRDRVKPVLKEVFDIFQLPLKPDDETATGYTFLEEVLREFDGAAEHMALVACFSKSGDLLSQWRGYANDAEGISIGYDRELLENCLRSDPRFSVFDIEYDEKRQIERLSAYLGNALFKEALNLPEIDRKSFSDWLKDEFDTITENLYDNYIPAMCSCKNPAFKEECEVRIVFQPGYDFYSEDYAIDYKIKRCARLKLNPLKYFVRNGCLVPFVDMNYDKALSYGLIKKIIVGPKVKLPPEEMRDYLFLNGFSGDVIEKIEIEKSSSSYR